MKQSVFLFLFLLVKSVGLFCQTKEYDLVSHVKSGEPATTVVYLNALWCQPCMEKLPIIVSTFSNNPSIKFIVLFERTGFDKYKGKLTELYDSSFFRLFPMRYYSESKGPVNIKINTQKKMFKRFLADYNKQLAANLTINGLWFGQAIIIKNKTIYITKNYEKDKMISEIESKINAE